MARDAGAQWSVALAYQQLGFIAQQQGEDARTIALFRASLDLAWALGRVENLFSLIGCLAIAAHRQQWEQAAQLGGVVEVLRTSLACAFTPLQQADYERCTAAVRARRHEPLVAAAWEQGQAMTLEEAIAYALTHVLRVAQVAIEPKTNGTPPAGQAAPILSPPPAYPGGLTAREVEVLHLLAQLLTQVEIA